MRVTYSILGWVVAVSVAAAQGDPEMLASVAKARLKALHDEAQKINDAWMATRSEPGAPKVPDLSPLVPKFQEAAAAYAGTDDAIPFLIWLLQSAQYDRDAAKGAAHTLATEHAASPKMLELAPWFGFLHRVIDRGSATELLNAIRDENEDPDVKAWMALADNRDTLEKSAIDSETFARAKKTLLASAEAASDERVRTQIRDLIHSRESFSVGCIAPDIEGIDLDGEKFRLSDYKGKIVFLDFWGDW